MNTLLMINVGGSADLWLREKIRGVDMSEAPRLQCVVVADSFEADRIFAHFCQVKMRKGQTVGGASSVRYDGPETITRELARYGAK